MNYRGVAGNLLEKKNKCILRDGEKLHLFFMQ